MVMTALTLKARIALGAIALLGAFALLGGPGSKDASAATYYVTVELTGSGAGTVKASGFQPFSCTKAAGPGSVTCVYTYGDLVNDFASFSGKAAPGSTFVDWGGDCDGMGMLDSCTFSHGNHSLTAQFTSLFFDPSLATEIWFR